MIILTESLCVSIACTRVETTSINKPPSIAITNLREKVVNVRCESNSLDHFTTLDGGTLGLWKLRRP